MKAKSFRFTEEDLVKIEAVKNRIGISSDTDLLRFCVTFVYLYESDKKSKVSSFSANLEPESPKLENIKDLHGYIDPNKFGHKEPGMIQTNQVPVMKNVNPHATQGNWESGEYPEKEINLESE